MPHIQGRVWERMGPNLSWWLGVTLRETLDIWGYLGPEGFDLVTFGDDLDVRDYLGWG